MDIKIPGGTSSTGLTQTVQESSTLSESTGETGNTEGISSVVAEGTDPVGQIATDLAAGRISGDEAVDRLIAVTEDSSMLTGAPEALRQELREVLESFIATDPYLSSLARNLGATAD